MTDARLRIIIDAAPAEARAALGALATDLRASGAAADEAGALQNRLALALANTEAAASRLSGAQAALAANTDPAQTAALKDEVLRAQVALDKEAQSALATAGDLKQLQGSTDDAAEATKASTFSFTELNSAISIGRQALQAIKQVYDVTVGSTIKYADEVRNLSRTIGASAEESSKLIQAADDVFISTEALTAGLEAAIRKGYEPTIANLGKLSDKYLSIQDPIERTKFLMDTFGRSGADLGALMEKGSKGIDAMGKSAEIAGQVLGQQDLQATLAVKQASDDLADSVQGLTIALSRGLIPGLVGAVDNLTYFVETMKQGANTISDSIKIVQTFQLLLKASSGLITWESAALQAQTIAQGHTNASMEEGNETRFTAIAALQKYNPLVHATTGAYDSQIPSAIAAGNATDEFAAALGHAADQQAKAIDAGLSGTLTHAQDDYRAVIADTTPEIDKLTAQIKKYQAAQGQTITVTEDATTSAAEFELANIKAAVAQQKVAEYTGDNRQEYLQLVVAADNASASVVKLGEGFGFSKDYTLDYTSKIRDANGSLAELNGKQAEAEAQLRKTTAEFVLQQTAAALTGDALLEFAHKTGLMNDADYNLATQVQYLTDLYDTNKDGVVSVAEGADQYSASLAFLVDKTADATVKQADLKTPVAESEGALAAAREEADNYAAALNSIPGDVHTTATIDHYDIWHAGGGANSTTGIGGGAAGGIDFIVPPGYPNDSFLQPVQSGERVTVTPAGQSGAPAAAGRGDTIIINDRKTLALYYEMQRQRTQRRHEGLM